MLSVIKINVVTLNIQVISEKENPLLKRKEIIISIDYGGVSTPSKADLQNFLANQFKADMDSI